MSHAPSFEDLVEQPLEPTKWLVYDVFLYYNKTHRIYKYILQPDGKTRTFTWRIPGDKPIYTTILVHDNWLLGGVITSKPLPYVLRGFLEKLDTKESLQSRIGEVRIDLVLKVNDEVLVDEKFIKALKLIEEYKSLKKVSQKLAIPYITLKKKIEPLERSLGTQVVVIKRGGYQPRRNSLDQHRKRPSKRTRRSLSRPRNRLTEQLWFISSDVTRKRNTRSKIPLTLNRLYNMISHILESSPK